MIWLMHSSEITVIPGNCAKDKSVSSLSLSRGMARESALLLVHSFSRPKILALLFLSVFWGHRRS